MNTPTKALLSCLFGGLLMGSVTGQNLVSNGSFEKYLICPSTIGQITRAVTWNSPTSGTPDFHNACASSIVDVPTNTWGTQAARTGVGYASCIVYMKKSFVGEYIQTKLTSPLVAGKSYDVRFWVSLTDKSRFAIAEMGAVLRKGAYSTSSGTTPLPFTPQVENTSDYILADKKRWMKISGTVIAKGGEDHIIIGCFKKNTATTVQTSSGSLNWANYYIDDVSVVPTSTGGIVASPHVIGWAFQPGTPITPGYLDSQRAQKGFCATKHHCRTKEFTRPVAAFYGGTAYDPRDRTVWVSDGQYLGSYYLENAKSCRIKCQRFLAVVSSHAVHVSGLAHAEGTKPRLFQLSTGSGVAEIATYDTTACPTKKPAICSFKLPTGAFAGGLAYDEIRDYLYISVSTPLKTKGFSHEVWVTTGASPCKLVCKSPLPHCNPNFVTGLAYDSCTKKLYSTDGVFVAEMLPLSSKCPTWKFWNCCKKSTTPRFQGLALLPGWTKKRFGEPCAQAPCADCPDIKVGCIGDPVPGGTFALTLQNAPIPSTAILFGKIGGCGPGLKPGAPYCGTWYALPPMFILPPVAVTGSAQCCGSAKFVAKIPALPNLCGVKLCFQWFFGCQGNKPGPGTGISRAVEFTITGG